MALRKLSIGSGEPIDWDKDYPNLSQANQLLASLAEYCKVPCTLKEYAGKKYIDSATVESIFQKLEKLLK